MNVYDADENGMLRLRGTWEGDYLHVLPKIRGLGFDDHQFHIVPDPLVQDARAVRLRGDEDPSKLPGWKAAPENSHA